MKLQWSAKQIGIYISVLFFLILGSYALLFLPQAEVSLPQIIQLQRKRITGSELPVVVDSATFPLLSAQGALAVDLDSAVVLYEKNADQTLLPASTTKIMTALVAMDQYKLNDVLTVPSLQVIGQRMKLIPGEKMTAENLLYGLLVFSANDAAEVLAANFPGGREGFISAMNQKAKELTLEHTHFVNPTGLDAYSHYSSARDLVRIAEVAMRSEVFAKIVGTKNITVKSVDNRFVHPLKNINELLGVVEGVTGVKTGWTEGARENLVTLVERNQKRILIALLGSQDRFGETKELIEWLYGNINWQQLSQK